MAISDSALCSTFRSPIYHKPALYSDGNYQDKQLHFTILSRMRLSLFLDLLHSHRKNRN